jgi:microcin C transport system substrate-binding protein
VRIDFYRDDGIAVQAFKAHAFDFRRETSPKRWAQDYHVPGIKQENYVDGKPAPFRALVFNTRRDLFKDIRVRQALQLAFDFDWLNKNLFGGAYARTESIYPKSALAANYTTNQNLLPLEGGGVTRSVTEGVIAETFPPPQPRVARQLPPQGGADFLFWERENLRRAMALLKEAGWEVKDGKLQNAAGQNFTFEILLNEPSDEKIALYYARALARLGITPTIRTIDSAQFIGRLEQFDFDMTVAQWVSTLSPGSEQAVYWGSRAANSPGSRNYAGITDPQVDADITALNAAKTQTELEDAAHALDRTIMNGAYFIPLYYAPADWVAYWPDKIMPPPKLSLYGTALEAWHAAP